MTDNWADDVKEFVELCEQGILYDDLMRRLNIPARRRDSFKRLFFSQVFFGKIKTTGRVRELFARDLPGTFIATIHDSIMTTFDKADEVRAIMVREFQRFGLNPMIRLEAY